MSKDGEKSLARKQCKNCGKFFKPHWPQEIYCSDACRIEYHHKKYRNRHGVVLWREKSEAERTLICANCGTSFVAKNTMRKYCSSKCKMDAGNKRAKEREYSDVKALLSEQKAERHASRIDDDAAKARAMGMSYGKYKALARIEAMHADFRRD